MGKEELAFARPSPDVAREWNENWQNSQDLNMVKYRAHEKILACVFEKFPKNDNLCEVYLKVHLLNKFYSTNIWNEILMAEHIFNLKIDKRLNAQNAGADLVAKIANVNFTNRKMYSFATKYCSFCKPDLYQIYDKFGSSFLQHWNRKEPFFQCTKNDYRDYAKYEKIVDAFVAHFGLREFSRIEIDRYIWQAGKALAER